jgi:hypothetical protein
MSSSANPQESYSDMPSFLSLPLSLHDMKRYSTTNHKLAAFSIVFLVLILLFTGCRDREYTGEHYLDPVTRTFMPQNAEGISYVNQQQQTAVCREVSVTNKLVVKSYDSGEWLLGGYYLYAGNEQETHTLTFDEFEITYIFRAIKNNGVDVDVLEVTIAASGTDEQTICLLRGVVPTTSESHWDNSRLLDSVTINSKTLYDVIEVSLSGSQLVYLQRGVGLASFRLGDDTWVLE